MAAVTAMYNFKTMRNLLVLLAFSGGGVAFAGKPPNVSDGEFALTPSYCVDTMGFKYGDAYSNTSPKAKHWVSLMGPSFWNMHHYCWAVLNLRRATLAGVKPQDRRALRESAVGDINYVITNSPSNFVLLPEILTTLGGVQILLSNQSAAYESYLRARQIKPDYWPAYADWADALIKAGLRDDAKKIVKSGLEIMPNIPELQTQYRALGGDPANIVPVKNTTTSPANSENHAQPPASPASSDTPSK